MMTRQQFEEEKTQLLTQYGETPRYASRKRSQELARLYAASGWSAADLAEVEQRGRRYIDQWLMFGRFLLAMHGKPTQDWTEGRFRDLWLQTDDQLQEAQRFAAVEALEEHTSRIPIQTSQQLTKALLAQFSDGKVHLLRDMANALDVDMQVLRNICDRIVMHGTFQTFGEKKPAAKAEGSYAYRFVKGGKKKINVVAFYAEVKPVLDNMDKLINGHPVHFSQQAMKMSFAQFCKVIDRVAR